MCCSCLLAVLQGVINSAVNFSIQTWCCQKSGPILVTVFAPLQTIFATVLALAFLGDSYYLGRYSYFVADGIAQIIVRMLTIIRDVAQCSCCRDM